jgi:hypothetical protein
MNLPLHNSYWVVPGRILAGEHPYGSDDSDTRQRLQRLRAVGVNYFIDLTADHELPPYRHLLPAQTKYLRSAIPDTEVPGEIAQMQQIQSRIRAALLFGRVIYVHCRAGIGRTALVAGCYLAEQGLDGKAALAQLNRLWLHSARSASWPKIPQTPEQAEYIRRWDRHRHAPDGAPARQPRVRR